MSCSLKECKLKLNFTEKIIGRCIDCKKVFCPLHRVPETHNCINIKDCIQRKSREVKNKPKFVNYSQSGHIGA
jgi:predicted nucleic acid binding AN1-type Zn finger protein